MAEGDKDIDDDFGERGYELSMFEEEVKDYLKCIICHEALRKPLQCKRGHSAYTVCIEEYLRIKNAEKFLCPICRIACKLEEMSINRTAQDTLMEMKVKCPYTKKSSQDNKKLKSCNWSGTLSCLENHLTNNCSSNITQCENEGCKKVIFKHTEKNHIFKACEYRSVNCFHCNGSICYKYLQNHYDYFCSKIPVTCSNKCTALGKQALMRYKMKNHEENDCVEELLKCTLKPYGCGSECSGVVKRMYFQEHVENPKNLLKTVQSLQKQICIQQKLPIFNNINNNNTLSFFDMLDLLLGKHFSNEEEFLIRNKWFKGNQSNKVKSTALTALFRLFSKNLYKKVTWGTEFMVLDVKIPKCIKAFESFLYKSNSKTLFKKYDISIIVSHKENDDVFVIEVSGDEKLKIKCEVYLVDLKEYTNDYTKLAHHASERSAEIAFVDCLQKCSTAWINDNSLVASIFIVIKALQ
jgi:hypothetical protein